MFIIENPVKMIPPFTETAIYWGDGNDNEGKKKCHPMLFFSKILVLLDEE